MINSGNVQKLYRNVMFPVIATVEEHYPEGEVNPEILVYISLDMKNNTLNKAKGESFFLSF